MTDAVLRPYRADDHDWLVDQHQQHYAASDGFDDSFAVLVSQILRDFVRDLDPNCAAGWIAEDEAGPVGSIFCVRAHAQTAKLRLFLLLPRARGTGLAGQMMQRCISFASGAGYTGMTLWTHRSHAAAGKVYARHGFDLVDEKPVTSFGVALIEQTWTRAL